MSSRTLVNITTTKETLDRLMQGTIIMKQIKSLQEQFKEWKLRYKDVVLALVCEENILAQKDLAATLEELHDKERHVE